MVLSITRALSQSRHTLLTCSCCYPAVLFWYIHSCKQLVPYSLIVTQVHGWLVWVCRDCHWLICSKLMYTNLGYGIPLGDQPCGYMYSKMTSPTEGRAHHSVSATVCIQTSILTMRWTYEPMNHNLTIVFKGVRLGDGPGQGEYDLLTISILLFNPLRNDV